MEQQKNTVAVMMSTYNGAPYLEEQILSILRQSAVEVRLFIRDDGSTDDTVHILERYASHAQVTVKCGANLGIGRSFMELLYSVPEDCDYYAFSDQDDIWADDKLITAIECLRAESGCALYASNLLCVDAENHELAPRFAPGETVSASLLSEINQNKCYGCTQVFNRELFLLLRGRKPSEELLRLRLHDTWAAVSAAAAGKIIYDRRPHIRYRRHSGNYSNFNIGKAALWKSWFCKLFHPALRNLRSKTAREVIRQYPDCVKNDPDRELIDALADPASLANKAVLIRHRKRFADITNESKLLFTVRIIAGLI